MLSESVSVSWFSIIYTTKSSDFAFPRTWRGNTALICCNVIIRADMNSNHRHAKALTVTILVLLRFVVAQRTHYHEKVAQKAEESV